MERPRAPGLAALVRELFVQGGVHVLTLAPAEDSSGQARGLHTMIAPSGDVVIIATRGVRTDGPLWASHMQAVRARLAPLQAFRSWLQSMDTWIVRAAVIAALISTAAALLAEESSWPERLIRIAIPSVLAALARRYSRRVLGALAGAFLRRVLSRELRAIRVNEAGFAEQ